MQILKACLYQHSQGACQGLQGLRILGLGQLQQPEQADGEEARVQELPCTASMQCEALLTPAHVAALLQLKLHVDAGAIGLGQLQQPEQADGEEAGVQELPCTAEAEAESLLTPCAGWSPQLTG